MRITYGEYREMGHGVVPEEQFERYMDRACAVAARHTQGRMAGDQETLELNRRGLCEIADICYLGDYPQSDGAMMRRALSGFTNQQYGETYGAVGGEGPMTVRDALDMYFSASQRWRGIDA